MRPLPHDQLGRRRRRGTRGPKPAPPDLSVLGLPTTTAAWFTGKLGQKLTLEKRQASRQTA
jgi:hypothetical protein